MMAKTIGLEHREDLVTYVIEERYRKTGRPFRCCQPRDLLTLAKNWCQSRGLPVEITKQNLDFAADVYFTVL